MPPIKQSSLMVADCCDPALIQQTSLPSNAAASSSSSKMHQPRYKALLIGVSGNYSVAPETIEKEEFDEADDDYNFTARSEVPHTLLGPKEDVRAFGKILTDLYPFKTENIRIVVDGEGEAHEQPTQETIMMAIEDLVADAQPSDHLVFVYSGHGFQLKAKEEDEEEDGLNEFITTSCQKGIKDNVLFEKMVKLLPPGCKLTAIFDCCHSATMLDLKHTKCNQVFTPRINKGKRRSATLHYQTKRRFGIYKAHSIDGYVLQSASSRVNSLDGKRSSSRDTLRVSTLKSSSIKRAFYQSENIVESSLPPRRLSQTRTKSRKFILSKIDTSIKCRDENTDIFTASPTPVEVPLEIMTDDALRRLTTDRYSSAEFISDSPDPQYVDFCDGGCHGRRRSLPQLEADVICLSSSQDCELTWEDSKGRSMLWHLMSILKKDPTPLLGKLMTDLSHHIHEACRKLHQKSRRFRRRRAESAKMKGKERSEVFGPENRRYSELEMTHFQTPGLSSHFPLDMAKKRWFA